MADDSDKDDDDDDDDEDEDEDEEEEEEEDEAAPTTNEDAEICSPNHVVAESCGFCSFRPALWTVELLGMSSLPPFVACS